MLAVVVTAYGGTLQAVRRPLPRPAAGEVLLRVHASGLCATDLHLLSGRQPLGTLPRVIGHELAGEIVALGAGVTGWQPGARVTAAIDVTCGRCRFCLTGQTQLCRSMQRIGFERDGGHADFVALPAANLVAVPAAISWQDAAILPDAVACMYHCLTRQGGVGIGQRVLILGAGGLGIHGVQIARAAGASVLATSRREERLALAEQFGAVGANTAREQLAVAVARFAGDAGVDLVADTVGTRESVREGLAVLRPGGKFLVIAYSDDPFEVPSLRFFKTEQQLIGCRGSTKQDLIDVVRLVESGQVKPVLGASYPLDAIDAAVARLQAGDLVGRIWLSRP
jgi:propanol-preferring alcohol dehydrogenase